MTRSTSILIRVTPEEAEAFKGAAKKAGLGVGPWLRSLGMRQAAPLEWSAELGCGHTISLTGMAAQQARAFGKPGRTAGCPTCHDTAKIVRVL